MRAVGSHTACRLAPFTFRKSASGRRAVGKAEKMGLVKGERLEEALALAGGSQYTKRGTGSNALGAGGSERAGGPAPKL